MEEKQHIKVNLSTVIFLLIIFVLIIIIIGMYYHYNYKENIHIDNTNNSNVTSMDEENTLENIINNNSTNMENNTTETNTDVEKETNTSKIDLTTNEAKKITDKYLNLVGSLEGSPSSMLESLGYDSTKFDESNTKQIGDYTYINTKINYNDFKNKMLKYMSEKHFNKEFSISFKKVNGKLYIANIGASGWSHSNLKLTLKSNSNNTYKYSISYINAETEEKRTSTVTITYENNHYVISDIKF
ncbi:MAG: hypothetical protein HFJ43_01185 [Clostridia bacterium]|nr:hypothetical protein [Clostridia bacterium]